MSLSLSDNIVRGLAAWRVAHMIVYERGPFSIFLKLREYFGITHDEDGQPIKWPSNSILACVWCLSVWLSVVFLYLPIKMVNVFSIAGVAAILESHNGES